MTSNSNNNEVLVLGGGLGGLLTAAILAKEGYKVNVIEQHKQIGGCLQSYAFQKVLFDSCVHYIGGLNTDNTLYKIFDYVEIMNHLELIPYDRDCFDKVILGHPQRSYRLAQGYDNFVNQLAENFPDEREALQEYVSLLHTITQKFPLYNLRIDDPQQKLAVMHLSLKEVLSSIFKDQDLIYALCGNAFLYAGQSDTTPFYIHALVISSYIEGAYKIKGSSAQIAKYLWKTIQKYGGKVTKNEKVVAIYEQDDTSFKVETANGSIFHGAKVISSLHPKKTMELLHTKRITKAFTNRVEQCPNATSAFMVNIVLEPNRVPYHNYNIYYNTGDPLLAVDNEDWPFQYAIYFTQDVQNKSFASAVSILTYLSFDEFSSYSDTFNTENHPSNRSESYQRFKASKANDLVAFVAQHFPELQTCLKAMEVVTPLTFRDYMGSDDGSIYGMVAEYNRPLHAHVAITTKLPNLYFTGQNVNMHGVLGVALTAVATSGAIVGLDSLLAKINNKG